MLPPMPKDRDLEASESDADNDEEMEEEEAPRAEKSDRSAAARRKEAREVPRRPKKRSKKKPPLPQTEAEIDSPKPLTLWMLGALAAATLIMWGSARFACNQQGTIAKQPPELPLVELARTPKDAAIELAQRWATYNFNGALELSKGSVAEELKAQKQRECPSGDTCSRKHAELSKEVLTTGALLEQDSSSALVRVSTTAPDGAKSYLLKLEPDGRIWKAIERRPESKH